MAYKAVLFDLDGTLLETLQDLMDTMNHCLAAHGMPERDFEHVRRSVGNGIRKLVERCVPGGTEDSLVEKIFSEFLAYYAIHCADTTRAYDGIHEMLEELRTAGVRMAVISNKADPAVQELLPQYFPPVFEIAVGERPGIARKPAPDMVEHALAQMGLAKAEAVYVGDSDVDVATARNSQVDCIACTWGFRTREELLATGATTLVDAPRDLVEMVMR